MASPDRYTSKVIDRMDRIDPAQWNALCPDDQPFISHAFLAALEKHDCVGTESGWLPKHLTLYSRDGELIAAMPLYLKHHSWGEFVFDFAWARAYLHAGLDYYPKLVSMCPFTPVTGRRVLASPEHPTAPGQLVRKAIDMTREMGASSLHVLYPQRDELHCLEKESLMRRQDVRFIWTNADYSNFDDFLSTFSADKRKKLRRERRRIVEQNICVNTVRAEQLTNEEWQAVYELCSMTFLRRGNQPYLSLDFFLALAPIMGERLLVNIARIDSQIVGAAILFRDDRTLYGRYWGGMDGLDCLHFETCYYRGIEYCIEQKLDAFDPGTQGEHKLRRGFAPTATWSAHWISDHDFNSAIGSYLNEERKQVAVYMAELQNRLPFRTES
ncbi:MAG: GNAT family N-acetyltransferase [Gammaproteobacteria bacterium]|nr:GNAT family N-acetyltransferase [Gammaproteobacteria bacterium]